MPAKRFLSAKNEIRALRLNKLRKKRIVQKKALPSSFENMKKSGLNMKNSRMRDSRPPSPASRTSKNSK